MSKFVCEKAEEDGETAVPALRLFGRGIDESPRVCRKEGLR